MKCHTCNKDAIKAIDSRPLHNGFMRRRRYECNNCGTRVTTYEMDQEVINQLINNKINPDHWRDITGE